MNIELLRKVQDAIRKEPELLDMSVVHNCHSCRCIGGWTLALAGELPEVGSWRTSQGNFWEDRVVSLLQLRERIS